MLLRFTYLFVFLVFTQNAFAQSSLVDYVKQKSELLKAKRDQVQDLVMIGLSKEFQENEKSCGEIELEKPGGTLEHVPFLNQGTDKTCYAQSATTLYNAYRKYNKDERSGTPASPSHVAFILSKYEDKEKNFDDGTAGGIKQLFQHPPCPMEKEKIKMEKMVREKTAIGVMDLKEGLSYMYANNELSNLATATGYADDSIKIKREYATLQRSCFGPQKMTMQSKNFSDVFDIVKNTDVVQASEDHFNLMCKENEKLRTSKPFEIDDLSVVSEKRMIPRVTEQRLQLMNKIHQEFNRGIGQGNLNKTLPVEISFCSYFLNDGPKSFIPDSEMKTSKKMNDYCSPHSVTVSGRRKNLKTGKCEFKIRDSEPNCESSGKFFDCNSKTGETWIDSVTLSRYMLGITKIRH